MTDTDKIVAAILAVGFSMGRSKFKSEDECVREYQHFYGALAKIAEAQRAAQKKKPRRSGAKGQGS
jgi:hypothetical protein